MPVRMLPSIPSQWPKHLPPVGAGAPRANHGARGLLRPSRWKQRRIRYLIEMERWDLLEREFGIH